MEINLVFVTVLCVFNKFVDHGSRRGDTAQALDQWRHPVVLSEVRDVLHRGMHPAMYRRTCMATKIASNSPAFFIVVLICCLRIT